MSKIKILIATHKEAEFPQNDIFLPIQVGKKNAKVKINIQGDNEGENISEKNLNYCELTAHYWAWKNLTNLDYIGLCHYRRFFNFENNSIFNFEQRVVSSKYLSKINVDELTITGYLEKYDIILAKATVYPYSIKFGYCYSHILDDYKIMESIFQSKFPHYLDSFNKVMKSNKLNHYNMFVTNFNQFQNYSKWLFDVLFEIEKEVKISAYPFQARVFGYMSERLLMVYCLHMGLKIKQLPVYFIDENMTNKSVFYKILRILKSKSIYALNKFCSDNY